MDALNEPLETSSFTSDALNRIKVSQTSLPPVSDVFILPSASEVLSLRPHRRFSLGCIFYLFDNYLIDSLDT